MAAIKFEEVKRTLHNIRNKCLPPPPKNAMQINDVFAMQNVFEEFGVSKHTHKHPFFKHAFECNDFSQTTIDLIDTNIPIANRRYLMDATFKVVPFSVFKQLLVVYVEYLDKVFISFVHTCVYVCF